MNIKFRFSFLDKSKEHEDSFNQWIILMYFYLYFFNLDVYVRTLFYIIIIL